MKKVFLCVYLCFNILVNKHILSQKIEIPEGYLLQYSQQFLKTSSINDYITFFNNKLKLVSEKNNQFLRLLNNDTITPYPALCILDNYIFGDFIFEFKARLKKSLIPEFHIVMSFKDTLNYYSIQLLFSTKDSINFKLIANDRGQKIIKFDKTFNVKLKEWNEFVVVRELIDRSIKFYVNNKNNPIVVLNDWSLVMGHIGFGIKNGVVDIDDVKIWSQTYIDDKLILD